MYKIGIIGSGPERFGEPEKIRRSIDDTINLLGSEYSEQGLIFNIKGEIGVAQWAVESCLDGTQKYHLFMPFSLQKTYEHWYDDQKEKLSAHYTRAHSLTICRIDNEAVDDAYEKIVDDSNFIVCFWPGNCVGQIAEAIKYALSKNKIVLDGLNDLRLLTNQSLKKF